MSSRKPYHGTHRKLVLAFDVGTTYSGISYSILDPGVVPQIKGVTRFPAQENVGGDSKIPSILWYDKEGHVCAIGAEALQESVIERAEIEGWIKLEWWKLHLRPRGLASSRVRDNDIPPLPRNKSAVEVLADFMAYLYRCARTYIQDTHANGQELWSSIESHIDFVLTHPNGWEGAQQSMIRRAAVLAELVSDMDSGQSRIQLVTEGEASLHFCIGNGLAVDGLADDQGVIIVDAGGGTIDLSAYHLTASSASFKEIAPTECLLQGSVFITRRAHSFLEAKLDGSKFASAEDIEQITGFFDKTTKLRFRNPSEPSYIKFGTTRDKDLAYNIRSGQLKLLGSEVSALFEPAIKEIIEAIEEQRRAAREIVSSVFLVGGFAASDWLFFKLQEYLKPQGINFCRPDSHSNKAVADGAVSFYLDHRVSVRVARWTYGAGCSHPFNAGDAEHLSRSATVFSLPSGNQYVPNGFCTILAKGIQVSEEKEFRKTYLQESCDLESCESIVTNIECFRGRSKDPKWMDTERGMFSVLCTVTANTSRMTKGLKPLLDKQGNVYFRQYYDIVLLFGLTELKAQISWTENGEEKRSPAKVVYDLNLAVVV